jgi:hypothetical protein
MERARHQLKNIDTANCYTIFPGENVARRMVFHGQKVCQYRGKGRFRRGCGEKERFDNGEHKHYEWSG